MARCSTDWVSRCPSRLANSGGAAQRAGQLVNAVQVQGGRLPALAAARAQRVQEEIIRQHSMALQNGEEFGQPQISAIIRSLA